MFCLFVMPCDMYCRLYVIAMHNIMWCKKIDSMILWYVRIIDLPIVYYSHKFIDMNTHGSRNRSSNCSILSSLWRFCPLWSSLALGNVSCFCVCWRRVIWKLITGSLWRWRETILTQVSASVCKDNQWRYIMAKWSTQHMAFTVLTRTFQHHLATHSLSLIMRDRKDIR